MKIKGGIDTIMDDERAKFAELEKLIAEHKDQKGALMPVLQGAQAIFGCVSEDVQKFSEMLRVISEELMPECDA